MVAIQDTKSRLIYTADFYDISKPILCFFTYSSFLVTTAIILANNLFFTAFNTSAASCFSDESHCVGMCKK